ncbi:MAG: hypothetical protein A3F91_09550 [Flavobacteria bacterium RIFCSPLOWO2_12_FULL_35_11]|nr:MAG: hypothetical protein A3F91_09550 [Flavobacteria bacterium RIFCSPLOWO2_12_FULL_35_11]
MNFVSSVQTETIVIKNDRGTLYGSFYFKDNFAKINSLEIKKNSQKKGYDSELVALFEKKCNEHAIFQIKIDAYKKSLGFWRKIGFDVHDSPQVIDGHTQDFYNGTKVLGLDISAIISPEIDSMSPSDKAAEMSKLGGTSANIDFK